MRSMGTRRNEIFTMSDNGNITLAPEVDEDVVMGDIVVEKPKASQKHIMSLGDGVFEVRALVHAMRSLEKMTPRVLYDSRPTH